MLDRFLFMRDAGDGGGGQVDGFDAADDSEDSFEQEFNNLTAEQEQTVDMGGDKGDEGTKIDPYLAGLKAAGHGDFKTVEEANQHLTRINGEAGQKGQFEADLTRNNQMFSRLKQHPQFNEMMYNSFKGGDLSETPKLPASLEQYKPEQQKQLGEIIGHFVKQELQGFKQEIGQQVSNVVDGKAFANQRVDYDYLTPRMKTIAENTGFSNTAEAMDMVYREARMQSIQAGDYPFTVDEQGNPTSRKDGQPLSGNNFAPAGNPTLNNNAAFNGPSIHNTRQIHSIAPGGSNRDAGSGGPKEPQNEKEYAEAWGTLMGGYER